jgi:hypothetical protein
MRLLSSLLLSVVALAVEPEAITIHRDQPLQVIAGLGFEIQSDSIGSGNHGLPEEPIGIPHDLVPSERERLATEMLKGFRYCRLAGGLYWRGLDAEQKRLQPRWPEQLQELKHLLDTAGVEGLSFEYWSPAPFWKSNRAYQGGRLRCFAKDFANDADYRGDQARFLADFAQAVVADIATLKAAGLPVRMFGLQNEPDVGHALYPTCNYPTSEAYVAAYRAVAGAVRAADPTIMLFADTHGGFPKLIGPGMQDPAVAALVDAYAVHIVGSPATRPVAVAKEIAAKLPKRPWFQNEYEYLTGGATRERCLNTVGHIVNSFQKAGCPTWFWIHCLKPLKNAEASGYSLGFWKSRLQAATQVSSEPRRRWAGGPEFTALPPGFADLELVSVKVIDPAKPAGAYHVLSNQPVTAYLVAEDVPGLELDPAWKPTDLTAAWDGGKDRIFTRDFPAGKVAIPATTGRGAGSGAGRPAAPLAVFLKLADPATCTLQVGINLPIEIRSQALAIERRAAAIPAGHWVTNPYNWHAVGSFVRHLPWDSTVLAITEPKVDDQPRVLAVRRPDGRMTVVALNRSTSKPVAYRIATGLAGATWRVYRYTPDEAGPDTRGVEQASVTGGDLQPVLPPLTWEFWEQQ